MLILTKSDNFKINVISSGSKGNAVLYGDVLIDCGVPYRQIKDFAYQIKAILLTHIHKDHLNLSTLQKLLFDNPKIIIVCGEWLDEVLTTHNLKHSVVKLNEIYDMKHFKISAFKLYHDVENCGYRLFINNLKIIHATDTYTLEGIVAKDYDIYAIEHNYDEDILNAEIESAYQNGTFTRARQSVNSHLSNQQAREFIEKNTTRQDSVVIKLHISSRYN